MLESCLGKIWRQMLCTKVSFDRWFFKKCKDVIWVGWKRINEDGQMGGEPIKKKLCSTILYIRLDFESHIEIQWLPENQKN